MNADIPTITDARRSFEGLVRSGALDAAAGLVASAPDREDRVAEGLAMTWAWYSRRVREGCPPGLALIRYVVRLRTVDRRRRFVSGDHAHWRSDVYARRGIDIDLRPIDDRIDEDSADDEGGWREDRSLGTARPGVADPATSILSGLDLDPWFDGLDADGRQMVTMRMEGYPLRQIADAIGCSAPNVLRRLRRLGRKFAAAVSAAVPGEPVP
jgi:DNA-directed RNA polymerase specialized sigma24 family protein